MAEQGLDRADGQSVGAGGRGHVGQGAGLGGVPGRRSGAVGVHVVEVGRVESGIGAGGAQQGPLRLGAGRIQPGGGVAVGVDGATADEGVDAVAVGSGVDEPVQHQHHHAFAAHIASPVGVEGAAHPVGGQDSSVGESGGDGGVAQQVGADHKRGIDLSGLQGAAGQVQGGARRRAGGVHRDRGTAQVEVVGEAVGQHRERQPGQVGHPRAPARGQSEGGLVGGGHSGPHAGRGARQRVEGDSGVGECLCGDLQGEALLGVHARGLVSGNTEEAVVEGLDLLQHPDGPRLLGDLVGVQQADHALPPCRGNGAGQVTAVDQGVPQLVGVVDAAGQAAADAGDRGAALHRNRDGGAHRASPRHSAVQPCTLMRTSVNRSARASSRSARESPSLASQPRAL